MPTTVLSAVAAATAVAQVWDGVLAGVRPLMATALAAATGALQPAVMSAAAAARAAEYLAVARKARQASETDNPNNIREAYDCLDARYDEIRTTPEPALPGRDHR